MHLKRQQYSTAQEAGNRSGSGSETGLIRLRDEANGVEVAVMPSYGNAAIEMKVHGKDILHFPSESPRLLKMGGIPILAPWPNRLDGPKILANGRTYPLRMDLGNIKVDSNGLPIHGLMWKQAWKVASVSSDDASASVTSRFDFSRHPNLMAQWPFAHEYEMTYRLADGELETRITVTNRCVEPMPLSLGFHPYIKIPEIPRDRWSASIPARQKVVTDDWRIPTGEVMDMIPASRFSTAGVTLDDGYSKLIRNENGHAIFSIEAEGKAVEVLFGSKFDTAIVWIPILPGGEVPNFVCFEPMSGVTNALNLHGDGKYPELQIIPPDQQWTESFWIRTRGI